MQLLRVDLWVTSVVVHPLWGETQRAELLDTCMVTHLIISNQGNGLTEANLPDTG